MTIIHFEARAKERGASLAVAQPAASLSPYLSTLIAPYQRYLVGESRRAEGIARYLWGLRRFLEWMGDGATVADVDGRRCQEYKEYLANDKHAAPATIINALAVLRDFSAFCLAKDYRIYNRVVLRGPGRAAEGGDQPHP